MKIFIITITSLVMIFACSSKKFEEPGYADASDMPTSLSFKTNSTNTWNAVSRVMQKYPISYENAKKGIITTDWLDGKSDRVYSGYGDNKVPYTVRYKITVKVFQVQPDITTVQVSNEEQYLSDIITTGDQFTGSLYKWYPVESSTRREYQVLRYIEEELKQIM